MVIRNFIDKIRGNTTLYYPGCHTKFKLKYEYNNYKEILKKLKINFIETNKFVCCGLPIYEVGYKKQAKELAQKNFERFKQRNVKKIITNCPSCLYMFNEIYPKLVPKWDITTEHISETILNSLKKYNFSDREPEELSYNDSPEIDNNFTREIIKLFNGKIIEPLNSKENSYCCGGHGGVNRNYPDLSESINKKRISEFPEEIKKIITPSGICYLELKKHDERFMELSTYILGKLRGKGI